MWYSPYQFLPEKMRLAGTGWKRSDSYKRFFCSSGVANDWFLVCVSYLTWSIWKVSHSLLYLFDAPENLCIRSTFRLQQSSPVSSITSGNNNRPQYSVLNQQGQLTPGPHQHLQLSKPQHYVQQAPSLQSVAQQQHMQHLLSHQLMSRPSGQFSQDMQANIAGKSQSRISTSSGGTSVHYPVSNTVVVGQQPSIANNNNNNDNSNTNNNGNPSGNSNNSQKQEQRLTHEQVWSIDPFHFITILSFFSFFI